MSSSSKESIARTGSMLLQGWKMLASSCPICHSPLMSNKDQLHCPGCDVPVRYEMPSSPGPRNSSAPPVYDEEEEEEEEEEEQYDEEAQVDVPLSLEEMKKEYDARHKTRDAVSKKLGERMLEGWTMLGVSCAKATCSGTPLMQSTKDPSKLVCVSCDGEYRKTAFGTIEPLTSTSGADGMIAIKVPTSTSPGAAPRIFDSAPILDFSRAKREGDSSSKIAAKLVQGWALLSEVCENAACGGMVPLMRDLNGVTHCVECGSNGSAQAATSLASVARSNISRSAPFRSRRRVGNDYDDDDIEEPEDEEDEEDVEDARDSAVYAAYAKMRTSASRPAASGKGATNGSNSAHVNGSSSASEEAQTLAILRSKLLEAAQQLQESADTRESIDLAELASKLASAIKAVRAL